MAGRSTLKRKILENIKIQVNQISHTISLNKTTGGEVSFEGGVVDFATQKVKDGQTISNWHFRGRLLPLQNFTTENLKSVIINLYGSKEKDKALLTKNK